MSVSRCYVVQSEDEGLRLDVLLGTKKLYASRSAAAQAIDEGHVLVGGKKTTRKQKVKAGDAIVYELPKPAVPMVVSGEPLALDIRFEDSYLLVLSKQAGLVCHPSVDHREHTLVNALIHHCGFDHLCNVQGDNDRLGIVHRLDKDTSGLMLAAKDDECGQALMKAIRNKTVDRRYLALVHGIIPHDTGMIDAPLARSAKDRKRRAVRQVPSSRTAVTTFRVLERFEPLLNDNGYTLIDCKLFTGRTHQIRAHLEYAHHPLVGDPVYTAGAPTHEDASLGLNRQFLHSFMLTFDHPKTNRSMHFDDGLPDDLQAALATLKNRTSERTDVGWTVCELCTHGNTNGVC